MIFTAIDLKPPGTKKLFPVNVADTRVIEDCKELNHIRWGKKLYYFDEVEVDGATAARFVTGLKQRIEGPLYS